MPQEADNEEVRKVVKELVGYLKEAKTPMPINQYSPQVIGLSAYLSSYDTQQLIKWNCILAVSTVILAIATVFLAIITYFKS